MTKKTKRVVGILSVILVLLISVAVVIGITKKDTEKKAGAEQETQYENEEVIDQENTSEGNSLDVVEEEIPDKVEVKEKKQATESEWLAAGMIVAMTLQYSDFEIEDIYVVAEDKKEACIIFSRDGERKAIYSTALDEERKESGTRDIYTKDLGFATFDEVSVDKVSTENLSKIDMDDLSELISQSILVSVYER